MDREEYFVRPFRDDDYEATCRLENLASPELLQDPEEERHWDRIMTQGHMVVERWVVESRRSAETIGFAALNNDPFNFDPHKFYVGVFVDPDHQGRGIGRALAGLLESEATLHHATTFWANVRKDNARGVHFAERNGFVELRTSWMSVLDLSGGPEPGGPREIPGVRLTTLAQEGADSPEVRRRLLDLVNEASRDVPRMGEFGSITPAQFAEMLDGPTTIPEAYFLARVGSEYVGVSNLQKDLAQSDSLFIGFTGTRKAFRGQGIASELKARGIAYAKRAGFRYLRTFNDSLNQPIWKINEKQGFVRTVLWSNRERRFAPVAGAPSGSPGRSEAT